MSIGKRVKEIRKKNKDTLKSLAKKIDYDWSNLSKVERGIYTASTELLEKISEVYNVDVSYFFYDDHTLNKFTDAEKEILYKRVLTPEELKKDFKLEIDDKEVTDEEIEIMINFVKALRLSNQKESS